MSWLARTGALVGPVRLHRFLVCIYSQSVWGMEALPFGKESRKALEVLQWNQFEGMKGHMGRDLRVCLAQGRWV